MAEEAEEVAITLVISNHKTTILMCLCHIIYVLICMLVSREVLMIEREFHQDWIMHAKLNSITFITTMGNTLAPLVFYYCCNELRK